MGQTVLVIAPHGLDEALGCGGAMARHADEGDEVQTLVLFGDGSGRDAARRSSAAAAATILGSLAPQFAGFPENRSDTLPLLEVIAVVEKYVLAFKPQVVYVSHGGSLNIDHQTAFRATATALRPAPSSSVLEFYAYEILSSTDSAPNGFGAEFRPSRFVEVTAQLERKMKALACYGDEMRPSPQARSLHAVRALAKLRGSTIGCNAAEAYSVLRQTVRGQVRALPAATCKD